MRPVSSSRLRKVTPIAVPGRCRVMTAPATRTRRPCRPPGRSLARSTPRNARSGRRSDIGCGPIVSPDTELVDPLGGLGDRALGDGATAGVLRQVGEATAATNRAAEP